MSNKLSEHFRELSWLRDLIVAMLKCGYKIPAIASLSVEDWHESFVEGLSPIEALQEDEKEAQ